MKELIHHLWKNNRKEIVEKSLKNCHCIGLDSIMLLESPGKTIRLFIANPNHLMWCNLKLNPDFPLTVAFHPHHCNVTLLGVHGVFLNWGICKSEMGRPIDAFQYDSKIKGGSGSFMPQGIEKIETIGEDWITEGEHISMAANYYHTVGVPKGTKAAWFVFEGEEDTRYLPLVYSNHNPNDDMNEAMYQPLTEVEIEDHLKKLNLIL